MTGKSPEAAGAHLTENLFISAYPGLSYGILVYSRTEDGEIVAEMATNEPDNDKALEQISATIKGWAVMRGIDEELVEDGIKVKIEAYRANAEEGVEQ